MLCFCQTILPSEKIFFVSFGNFRKYNIVPIFLFKTFQLRIQAAAQIPPIFFHMWTSLWTGMDVITRAKFPFTIIFNVFVEKKKMIALLLSISCVSGKPKPKTLFSPHVEWKVKFLLRNLFNATCQTSFYSPFSKKKRVAGDDYFAWNVLI